MLEPFLSLFGEEAADTQEQRSEAGLRGCVAGFVRAGGQCGCLGCVAVRVRAPQTRAPATSPTPRLRERLHLCFVGAMFLRLSILVCLEGWHLGAKIGEGVLLEDIRLKSSSSSARSSTNIHRRRSANSVDACL